MTPDEYTKAQLYVEQMITFRIGDLRGKIPYGGEVEISLGTLSGVARATFQAERDYQTLRYVLISNHTPILWKGVWGWMIPPQRMMTVDNQHYLLALELADELE